MYQFNDQGMLKDFAVKQESFLTNIMFRRGLLTPEDTIYKSLTHTDFRTCKIFYQIQSTRFNANKSGFFSR